jgi:regulator of sirC expression with transglutaminase-like and TPR domain
VNSAGALIASLAAVGAARDQAIDLAQTALILAALDHRATLLDGYRAHLGELARDAAAAAGPAPDLARRIDALTAIFARHGYSGDVATYDDPDNADLIRVIDRRKGLPVALAILWIHAARANGWPAAGLAFPGHFLIRLETEHARAIVDPFHGGKVREPGELRELLKQVAGLDAELRPAHYAAVGNRDVLLRLLNNVKLRSLQAGDAGRAAEIIDRLRLIAPDHIELLREAGLCHARLGNLARAGEMLSAFVDAAEDGPAKSEAAALLQRLRARLN